ncbi:MAG: hypothetical protein O2783_07270 [Chloroflexi bacterium]|nr:hypothetical protein [Chloroflexota bacterium]
MPRIGLDMNKAEDLLACPARLADHDDSGQLQHRFSVSGKFEPPAMVI